MAETVYAVGGQHIRVQMERDGNEYQISIDGESYLVRVLQRSKHTINFTLNGKHILAHAGRVSNADERLVWLYGRTWTIARVDAKRNRHRHDADDQQGTLTASMPGQVVAVLVKEGESVNKGNPLITLEAMKMEMRIVASQDGIVTQLNCQAGDIVDRGQILAVISGGD